MPSRLATSSKYVDSNAQANSNNQAMPKEAHLHTMASFDNLQSKYQAASRPEANQEESPIREEEQAQREPIKFDLIDVGNIGDIEVKESVLEGGATLGF